MAELEAKFYVTAFDNITARLHSNKAALIRARTHEYNLLFDNTAGDLTRRSQVLRLRIDDKVRMTFKGKGKKINEVYSRQEYEFTVNNLDHSQGFLEALGYEVVWIYEKYRTTYKLDEVIVTLDEMPFGNFVEVEGPTSEQIRSICDVLDLNWDSRILGSYHDLFKEVQKHLQTEITNLTFKSFADLIIPPESLGVKNKSRF